MSNPPDREMLHSLHERLLLGDRVASEELSRLLLAPLQQEVTRRFPRIDEQMINDGVVDAADYVLWRKNGGTQADYELWRENFGASAAALAAAALGAIIGFLVGDAPETIAGGVAGFVGAVSAAAVALGGFRRGATRLGVAVFLCLGGLLVSVVALIPLAGYVEAVVLPLAAVRLRARRPARFAGLRTLAK